MNLCRFQALSGPARVGIVNADGTITDLSPVGIERLEPLLEEPDLAAKLAGFASASLPRVKLAEVKLLPPLERQEVWAVGVTYLRSKKARMEESDFSATAYDKVYEAPRPELFFKSQPEKVSPTGGPVGIRRDAKWNVPEPELALVLNSKGQLAGYTIGNDMSSRDIEGENLLYLPQAKIYKHSCALGPWITIGASEADARTWNIRVEISRAGQAVFSGETSVGQIKRTFQELIEYLFRSQEFPQGAVLLTGTGVVPPDGFTLAVNDSVRIAISGIGEIVNQVVEV